MRRKPTPISAEHEGAVADDPVTAAGGVGGGAEVDYALLSTAAPGGEQQAAEGGGAAGVGVPDPLGRQVDDRRSRAVVDRGASAWDL